MNNNMLKLVKSVFLIQLLSLLFTCNHVLAQGTEPRESQTNSVAMGCLATEATRSLNAAMLLNANDTVTNLTQQWTRDNEEGRKHICWGMPPQTRVLVRFSYGDDYLCVSEIRRDTGKPTDQCYYVARDLVD
jgi:hypothetical protein